VDAPSRLVSAAGDSDGTARPLTGWVYGGLTRRAEADARSAGLAAAQRELLADVVQTSVQRRAIRTAEFSLDGCGRTGPGRRFVRG